MNRRQALSAMAAAVVSPSLMPEKPHRYVRPPLYNPGMEAWVDAETAEAVLNPKGIRVMVLPNGFKIRRLPPT